MTSKDKEEFLDIITQKEYTADKLVDELMERYEVPEIHAIDAVERFIKDALIDRLPEENIGKCMPDVAYYIWETKEFWEIESHP